MTELVAICRDLPAQGLLPVDRGAPLHLLWHNEDACAWSSGPTATPTASIIHRETGTCIAVAGRLDPIARAPRMHGMRQFTSTLQGETDAALALYLSQGSRAVRNLTGDFALVLWNPRVRRLLAMREGLGSPPLYHMRHAGVTAVSTSLPLLLQVVHPNCPPDLHAVYDHLTFAFPDPERTLYRGIRILPPHHFMSVRDGREHMERTWDPRSVDSIRYRDQRDYRHHYLELLTDAVDRRLPPGPVGLMLSGGIDSSAVAAIAASVLSARGDGDNIHALSLTYPNQACDESRYIDSVVAHLRVPVSRFPFAGFSEPCWIDRPALSRDIPEYPLSTRSQELYRHAETRGIRVLLTGEGGDQWHDGSNLPHWQLIATGKLMAAAAEVRYRATWDSWSGALRALAGSLAWRLSPRELRPRLMATRPRRQWSSLLSESFLTEYGRAHACEWDRWLSGFPDAAQWQIVTQGMNPFVLRFQNLAQTHAARHGVELRHPLLDRRLIDYLLAIPDFVRRQCQQDRLLLRATMRPMLPLEVIHRHTKASFSTVLLSALQTREVQAVLNSPQLAERPWIDRTRMNDCLAQIQPQSPAASRTTAAAPTRLVLSLWMAFAIEAWLTSLGPTHTTTG